jgi:acyl-CoA synthetase (AMP-forming)/AMP-acid ligase II
MSGGAPVPDLLGLGVRRYPDRPCVVVDDRSSSFAAVSDRAGRFAAHLAAAGIGPGARVALLALNEAEFIELRVGTQRAGASLVPLNYRLAAAELEAILDDCEPDLLILGPDLDGLAAGLTAPAVLHLGPGGSYEAALAAVDTPVPLPAALDPDAIGLMSYTSGTTGRPKGVMLSNAALHATTLAMGHEIGAHPDGVYLASTPLFHIGHTVGFAFTYLGATSRHLRKFDVAAFTDLLGRGAFTHTQLVPAMFAAILEQAPGVPAPALQRILYGAAPMPPELAVRIIEAWGCELVNGFGSTEAMGVSMLSPAEHDPIARPGLLASVGRASAGMTARVVDDEGRDVLPGEVGEIIAKGPNVMSGYWRNPQATEEALRDGWMHLGDLGYRDAEGYLYLVDRRNDKIVTGGENVYPSEVEHVLLEHPAVHEAAVVGVPDDRWGEAVSAVVVLRGGANATAADLSAHCRERLAGYKVPKAIRFADAVPRTATGKLLRRELREQWARDTAGSKARS